jgi:transmembrane sensor
MQQRTVIELLALKFSGDASPEDLKLLEKLIREKPDSIYHKEILEQMFSQKQEEVDVEYHYHRHRLKYQDKLIFAEQTVSAFNHFKSSKYLLTICSFLFVLGISSLFIFSYLKQVSAIEYNTQIVSGKGVKRNILLPDGTKVWLNAGSKLVYDKDMNDRKIRAVKLIGEAFFDVAHNKHIPFVITTSKISLKVLGTSFNIKAYPSDFQTEAMLIKGSIELSVNNSSLRNIMLKPLEKFSLSERGKRTVVIKTVAPLQVNGRNYTEEVSWMEDQLVFNNESLETLIPRLEKWFKVKIKIENKKIEAYSFTGVFNKEDVKQALTAMQLIKHFNFKIVGHDVILY